MASSALLCLAFLAFISQQMLANADAVTSICDRTMNKQVCLSIFAAYPERQTADVNALANVALDAAVKQAKDIQLKIMEFSKSSADKALQQRFVDCANNYQHAIVDLGNSKNALASKNFAQINALVSSAMAAGETCEDGFQELPGGAGGGASPLTEMNVKFKGICGIALTITKG